MKLLSRLKSLWRRWFNPAYSPDAIRKIADKHTQILAEEVAEARAAGYEPWQWWMSPIGLRDDVIVFGMKIMVRRAQRSAFQPND